MSFKVKHMIFGKIAIILCLCLVLNNTFIIKSYAENGIATQNPLFIPITTFVTAGLIGSGMIAKNSQEALNAGGQLVNNIISQIKSSEIAKSEADSNYDSPYRVINGGQPEKPNNNNKNGKWVAVAGGALASNEIYANKEAIKDILSKANSLGGYDTSFTQSGVVSSSVLLEQSSASNIALQLANISNSAVKQFDDFLHSDWWANKDFTYDDCYFTVNVFVPNIIRQVPLYPQLFVGMFIKNDNLSSLELPLVQSFNYNTYSNNYGSLSYYSAVNNGESYNFHFLDKNNIRLPMQFEQVYLSSREDITKPLSISSYSGYKSTYSRIGAISSGMTPLSNNAYCGYKWTSQNPIQFTNNVYNVNMSFDENFQNWLQGQIQGLGGQLIDAVRLGLTSVNTSWNPTQEQIQEGTTPSSVIYQFINNYENPENIPEEEEDPDTPVVVPPAVEEPQPTNDYLGNFLLPESITTKFPFCIPFDVARCLRLFSVSQREAPKWECDLNYGSNTYHIVIDLAMFNDVANFIRPLEYILFLVGLAMGTRSLIRG